MAEKHEKVFVEFKDDIAIIRLIGGENRLDPVFISEFNNALNQVEGNVRINALITTGEGKFYSNGINLRWLNAQPEKVKQEFVTSVNKLCVRLLTFPMPTLAAINGHAFAAGMMIALCHDYRVMRQDRGWMCMNEVFIRLTLQGPMLNILKTKIPSKDHLNAIVFGHRYTADDAKAIEVVHAISDMSTLESTACSLVKKILSRGDMDRAVVKTLKENLYTDLISNNVVITSLAKL